MRYARNKTCKARFAIQIAKCKIWHVLAFLGLRLIYVLAGGCRHKNYPPQGWRGVYLVMVGVSISGGYYLPVRASIALITIAPAIANPATNKGLPNVKVVYGIKFYLWGLALCQPPFLLVA